MHRLLRGIGHEVRELLPAFLYFLVAFNLIVVTDALTTEQYGVRPFSVISAIVGALVAAKVVWLVNLLPFMERFRGRPLIYPTLWKASLFIIAALVVRYIEHVIRFAVKYGGLVEGTRHLVDEVIWSRFWAIQIWLAVLFLVFVAAQELSRALGDHRLRRMFFGERTPPNRP